MIDKIRNRLVLYELMFMGYLYLGRGIVLSLELQGISINSLISRKFYKMPSYSNRATETGNVMTNLIFSIWMSATSRSINSEILWLL